MTAFVRVEFGLIEIRLIAKSEVSPPFGEDRASRALRRTAVEQEISFPANKQRRL